MNKNLTVLDQREVLGKEFRVYGTKEEPLFLAKDVAEWIEYSFKDKSKGTRNVNMMLQMIDEDEKVKRIMGVQQSCHPSSHGGLRSNTEMWFLTEDGLYEVLMQSRKPIAKSFKKEVKTILKQIRITGGYIPVKEEDREQEIVAKALMIMQNTLAKKDVVVRVLGKDK